MITGNKGEWSEIYTLLCLLGNEKIYAEDENLERIENIIYPVIKIIRNEGNKNYDYSIKDKNVIISDSTGNDIVKLPTQDFVAQAKYLLKQIEEARNNSFSVAETEEFMHSIRCTKLKGNNCDKTDIHVVLHDERTEFDTEMGFSIKSRLGCNATLLNATKATNFAYKVDKINLSDSTIETINSIETPKKIKDRYNAILQMGGQFSLVGACNDTFQNNLRMIDADIEPMLGNLLQESMTTNETRLKVLIEKLSDKNILGIKSQERINVYKFKMKNFLVSVALGMMPSKEWNGIYDANGGYIIVKEDGELLCYHFYDRNRFSDYLLNNTYLERGSTTRHEYAKLYRKQDNVLFNLNLQIRFK